MKTLVKISDDLFVPENFSRNHYYYADAEGTKKYTGVSSVLNTVYAKPWLMKWSANMAVDFITKCLDEEGVWLPVYDENWEKQLEEARVAYIIKSKEATDFGTDAHARAEEIIKEGILNNQGFLPPMDYTKESPQIQNLVKWATDNDVRFIESEKRLHNKEMFLAGTADFVCEMKGMKFIGDIKTSKQLSYDYLLQCAAYSLMLDYKIDGTILVRTGKGGKVWNKETRTYSEVDAKDDFEVEVKYDLTSDQTAFKAALQLYRARAASGEDI